MATQTQTLNYRALMGLEGKCYELEQLNGLWHWEASGRFARYEIGSADGFEDFEDCKDNACDVLAACAEYGVEQGLSLVDHTVRLAVTKRRNKGTLTVINMSTGDRVQVPANAKAKNHFCNNCTGWDMDAFNKRQSFPIRMRKQEWRNWLSNFKY